MKKQPVIAIDGYSSTGKSSISKIIAQRLGLIHIDTGALYRGVTYYALKNCKKNDGSIDLNQLFKELENLSLEFSEQNQTLRLTLNGQDISQEIRKSEIADHVSFIAKQPEVRHFLLDTQRRMAKHHGVVMDGRDIGTVVLPNADYKFFLTASVEERTKRRHLELLTMGESIDAETVKKNLIERDRIDSQREIAPLKQADDAILIDNSLLSKEETIELLLSYLTPPEVVQL
ncbi:(d)CMP kinase [Bergeyella sp. RCAD1439]|uniref:(d)CMP kinase n=1 Tax=Bergeyella anatis TaxID=3113737 RepID=UPI002E1709A1|nr:(d)CMP kinase [Bergeyella sp. RCAD1439]